jgi:serine/threonine protein phosphatase 1
MKYAMSDLHGRFDKYSEMLNKINFTEDDELFLLGDVCDRGPESAQIFLDMMNRKKNVYPIMGNHEKMLLEALPNSFGFLQKDYGYYATLDFDIWSACGGGRTCASLIEAGVDKVVDIYNYILSFPFYRVVDVNGRNFLLVHAGLDNYERTKRLGDYLPEELVWYGFDHNGTYYPLLYDRIIVGHTPTFLLNHDKPAKIYHGKGGNVIDIDCGAVFEEDGGRLACLCLDTMEEFYV